MQPCVFCDGGNQPLAAKYSVCLQRPQNAPVQLVAFNVEELQCQAFCSLGGGAATIVSIAVAARDPVSV